MQFRTDLAYERSIKIPEETPGIHKEFSELAGVGSLIKITIKNKAASEALKKPMGRYYTLEATDVVGKTKKELYEIATHIADLIKELLPKPCENILILGLGNRYITPDALGPKACEQIFVSQHIKQTMPDLLDEGYASVCALAPGVMGTTGLPTARIAKALVKEQNIELVIAIDALAAQNVARVGSSVQISDTGITPGSGLGGKKEGLNEETLGVKVLSIGIPMVTYASVIAWDLFDQAIGDTLYEEEKEALYHSVTGAVGGDLIVTPKNIDVMVARCAHMLGMAINLAVHKKFDVALAAELTSHY